MDQEQAEIWEGNRVAGVPRVINSDDARYDLFVEGWFLFKGNKSKAAIHAGYSERSAHQLGSLLAKRPEIAQRIADRQRENVDGLKADVGRVLEEAYCIALASPVDLYGSDGKLKFVSDLDEKTRRALAHLRVDEEGRIEAYRFLPKAQGIDIFNRAMGVYKDKDGDEDSFTLVVRAHGSGSCA